MFRWSLHGLNSSVGKCPQPRLQDWSDRRTTAMNHRTKNKKAIPKDILDLPCVRSRNAIGISITFKPGRPRRMISNTILKPIAGWASSRNLRREIAKNPDIESWTPVNGNSIAEPARDIVRRQRGQPGVEPPRI